MSTITIRVTYAHGSTHAFVGYDATICGRAANIEQNTIVYVTRTIRGAIDLLSHPTWRTSQCRASERLLNERLDAVSQLGRLSLE